jgi:hypothetical protein
LLGIVLGTLLSHTLALRRDKAKSREAAASNFRDAFIAAQKRIGTGENPVTVISDQFHHHLEARLRFVEYLSGAAASNFGEDWERYATWHSVMCNRSLGQVMYGQDDPQYVGQKDKHPLPLIEALLKYARVQ